YFVSDELYQKFDKEILNSLLKQLGVEDKPRRIEININLTLSEKEILRRGAHYFGDRYVKDYNLDGFEHFFSDVSQIKSILLWKMLLECIKDLNHWSADYFFTGEYKWYYNFGYESTARFEAKFTKSLKQTAWLFNKNGDLCKSSDIS